MRPGLRPPGPGVDFEVALASGIRLRVAADALASTANSLLERCSTNSFLFVREAVAWTYMPIFSEAGVVPLVSR